MSTEPQDINKEELISKEKERSTTLKEKIKKYQEELNDVDLKTMSTISEAQKPNMKQRKLLVGHASKVFSVFWSKSYQFVSSSQDGNLIVWDAKTAKALHLIPFLDGNQAMSCTFSPSGNFVAGGSLDNVSVIYKLQTTSEQTNKPIKVLGGHNGGHTGYVSAIQFVADSSEKNVVSCGDSSAILWDIETGKELKKFKEHTGDVLCLSLNPSMDTFLTGSCDCNAKIWDIKSGKCIHSFSGNEGEVNCVQYFPNGLSFATGNEDGSCKLYDIRANRELLQYKGEEKSPITGLTFSRSGKYLFSGNDDNKIVCWDVLKGKKAIELLEHQGRISSLQVSHDGMALLSGSWDKSIRVWA